MAIQRRAITYGVRTAITAAAIQAWHTTPIEIAPAPGVGRIIQPLSFLAQYKFGTVGFTKSDGTSGKGAFHLYLDATRALHPSDLATSVVSFVEATADRAVQYGRFATVGALDNDTVTIFAPANSTNAPLMLVGANDLQGGAIATSTLNAAGLLYAPGDTGTIDPSNNGSATYTINTVGGGGAVATYTITTPGSGYVVANAVATDTSGTGSGFKVNITAINKGNGSLITTVFYGIVQLL